MAEVSARMLSGIVVRSIMATARTRTERFSVIFNRPTWNSSTREMVQGDILGERAFSGSSDAPIVLWDALLPVEALENPGQWFGGNVLNEGPPPETVDASGFRELPDEDFWPVIDVLGGRMWEKTINAAAAFLAGNSEEFILRWAETAALKALAVADVLEAGHIRASGELHAIGAVLGKGKRVFRSVTEGEVSFDPRWLSDYSPQVIWIGAHALDRVKRRFVFLETSMSERHRAILEREKREIAEYQRRNGIVPAPREPSFKAARGVVDSPNGLRERLVLVPLLGVSEPDEAGIAALTADGSRLMEGPEFSNHQGMGLWGGTAFTIKRRSSLPVAEYVNRYVTDLQV